MGWVFVCVCDYANIKKTYYISAYIKLTYCYRKFLTFTKKRTVKIILLLSLWFFFFLQYGNHNENIPRDEPEITGSVANLIDKLILMKNIVNFFPLLIVVTMINQLCGTWGGILSLSVICKATLASVARLAISRTPHRTLNTVIPWPSLSY